MRPRADLVRRRSGLAALVAGDVWPFKTTPAFGQFVPSRLVRTWELHTLLKVVVKLQRLRKLQRERARLMKSLFVGLLLFASCSLHFGSGFAVAQLWPSDCAVRLMSSLIKN